MKPASLLGHLLASSAALVAHTCMAAPFLNVSRPVVDSSSVTSPVTSRRLGATGCTILKQTIKGVQYLQGNAPLKFGSFLAMCNEDPENPILTCFMDDGILDSKRAMHVVDCDEVAVAQRRRLAMHDKNINDATKRKFGGGTWPKGVVCYTFNTNPDQATAISAVRDDVLEVFKKYHKGADEKVRFIDIKDCVEAEGVCNGCKHAAVIATPASDECSSSVGMQVPSLSTPKEIGDYVGILQGYGITNHEGAAAGKTFQTLILGTDPDEVPQLLCSHPRTIAHEVGHTLGLLHDHQHVSRKQKVFIDLEKVDPHDDRTSTTMKILVAKLAFGQATTAEEKAVALKALKEALNHNGEYVRKKNNYRVDDFEMDGEYKTESIMHYNDYQGFCVRKADAPAIGKYCDYGDNYKTCTKGLTAHCDKAESRAKWEKQIEGPTEHDYKKIETLYKSAA